MATKTGRQAVANRYDPSFLQKNYACQYYDKRDSNEKREIEIYELNL